MGPDPLQQQWAGGLPSRPRRPALSCLGPSCVGPSRAAVLCVLRFLVPYTQLAGLLKVCLLAWAKGFISDRGTGCWQGCPALKWAAMTLEGKMLRACWMAGGTEGRGLQSGRGEERSRPCCGLGTGGAGGAVPRGCCKCQSEACEMGLENGIHSEEVKDDDITQG